MLNFHISKCLGGGKGQMKNKYFTIEERYKLEVLLEQKYKPKEITNIIDHSLSTIYLEIKRGTVELMRSDLSKYKAYKADVGQRIADENSRKKGRPDKLSNDAKILLKIENQILKNRVSPDVAIATCCTPEEKICTTTLYNYIDKGKLKRITNNSLPYKRACKKRLYRKIKKVALNNRKGRSIAERSLEIDDREIFGHWEMDTVVGSRGNGKKCLLVLTERVTRQNKVFLIKDRTAKSIHNALAKHERKIGYKRFKSIYKTITCDNGVEFLDMQDIETSVINGKQRTTVYYAHPYSSWERGSNENNNKLIRRWIPKGNTMENVTNEFVEFIENWMNNYPRRMFNYLSANDLYKMHCTI